MSFLQNGGYTWQPWVIREGKDWSRVGWPRHLLKSGGAVKLLGSCHCCLHATPLVASANQLLHQLAQVPVQALPR